MMNVIEMPRQQTLFGMAVAPPITIACDGDPLDEHDSAIAELRSAYAEWSAAQGLMAEAQARLNVAIAVEKHCRAALAVEVR
jgi:hypothetical protein